MESLEIKKVSKPKKDLTGQVFGRYTVVEYLGNSK